MDEFLKGSELGKRRVSAAHPSPLAASRWWAPGPGFVRKIKEYRPLSWGDYNRSQFGEFRLNGACAFVTSLGDNFQKSVCEPLLSQLP